MTIAGIAEGTAAATATSQTAVLRTLIALFLPRPMVHDRPLETLAAIVGIAVQLAAGVRILGQQSR